MQHEILALIDNIHHLRMVSNQSDVGFGFDKYQPKQQFHYDEAYALWGLGYLNLHKQGNNISDSNLLDHILDYFHKHQRYDGSLGLPWDWQGQKKEEGYLITTSFVGCFLLEYDALFSNERTHTMMKQIEDYILSLNTGHDGRVYLRYSKHLNEDVLNAYAVAALFLSFHNYGGNQSLIEQLMDSIEHGQREDGGFIYMLYPRAKLDMPDNYHQCFIINSLAQIDGFLRKRGVENQKIRRMLDNSIDYFMLQFFDDDMYLRRRAKEPLLGSGSLKYRRTKVLWAMGRTKRRLLRQPPSRSKPILYDFGQTLALLSTNIDQYPRHLESVVEQAGREIEAIREGNPYYIRDLGHLFYGLTEVLLELS